MHAERAGHQGFKTDGFLFHPDCVCEEGFFVQGSNPIHSAEYHPGEGYRGGQLQTLSDLHQERAASNGSGSPTYFDWPVAASASEGMTQNNSNNLGSWPAMEAGLSSGAGAETCSNVLLSNLSVLQQKAQQLEAFVQEGRHDQQGSVTGFISSILYELIGTAASLLLSVHNRESANLAPADVPTRSDPGGSVVIQADNQAPPLGLEFRKRANPNGARVVGFGGGSDLQHSKSPSDIRAEGEEEEATTGNRNPKIIEINETDILTEHAHFCEMCGKGFRREANVRMHMRAHGDEYKTNQALMSKPLAAASSYSRAASKYSCPSERCRRNKNHRNFKPLKSITSLRNHYKRSHCPKMYTCQRCDKQFSIVGDLKTHGKHCGHSLWRCSCGTTFTRKDKLLSHVTLFQGHKPLLLDHELVLPPAPKRDKAASNGRATTAWSSGYGNNANHTEFAAADLAGLGNDKIQGYEDVIQMGHGQHEVTLESRLTDSVFWVNS